MTTGNCTNEETVWTTEQEQIYTDADWVGCVWESIYPDCVDHLLLFEGKWFLFHSCGHRHDDAPPRPMTQENVGKMKNDPFWWPGDESWEAFYARMMVREARLKAEGVGRYATRQKSHTQSIDGV